MQRIDALGGKRTLLVTGIVALVAGNATALGLWLKMQRGLFENGLILASIALAFSALLFVALLFLWKLLDRLELRRNASPPRQLQRPGRACAVAALIVFACWVPALLAGWPGFFAYDSGLEDPLMQWSQVEAGRLNAHHSILHTIFLEATIRAGEALFGSFNAGICTSVVIQALIVAAIIWFVLSSLVGNGMGKCGFILSTAYYSLHPTLALFAFCTTKDTIFSALVVAFCLVTLKLYDARDAEQGKRRRLAIALALLGFIMCVLRANAIVALVVTIPVLALVMKRPAGTTFAAAAAAALVLAAIWLVPVSRVMGVESSPIGKWNALGIPMQQIALCERDSRVSEEDHDAIRAALGEVEYKQNNSDYARDPFCYREGGSRDLIGLYLELGLKYPGVYTEAALLHTEDAWSPFAVIDAYNEPDSGLTSVFDFRTMSPGHMEPVLPELRQVLWNYSALQSTAEMPPMRLFNSIALYLFMLIVCLARAIITRNRATLCFYLPLAVLALGNLCGPCMLIRYFLYLFYALPACLYLLVGHPDKNAHDR